MRKNAVFKKLSIKKITYANASKINKGREREDNYLCFVLTIRLQFINIYIYMVVLKFSFVSTQTYGCKDIFKSMKCPSQTG